MDVERNSRERARRRRRDAALQRRAAERSGPVVTRRLTEQLLAELDALRQRDRELKARARRRVAVPDSDAP